MREIKNDCKHKSGFLFAVDYTPAKYYSTLTGSESAMFVLNRYCKDCRGQMGFIDLTWDALELHKLEFTSPEVEEWFKKQTGL